MNTPHQRNRDRHASAADRLAARLAANRKSPKVVALTLVLAGLTTTTAAVAVTRDERPETAAVAASTPLEFLPEDFVPDLADLAERNRAVSRSLTRRADVTVDVREHRIQKAIEAAEKRAAAEKRRLERIAKRKAEAKAARIAARKAAAEKAAQEAAAKQAALDAAASTDPGTLRDMARNEMLAFGFAADQWTYLDRLVMRESGWNPLAQNPSSGAYGLPQSLPGSKMASEGADWRTNPVTQIRWMLKYIAGRYGNPAGAWAHSESVGWY